MLVLALLTAAWRRLRDYACAMVGQGQRSPRVDSASVCTAAFLTLLALKLAGVIGWSWWLVTLPLWGQAVIPVLWLWLLLGGGAPLCVRIR